MELYACAMCHEVFWTDEGEVDCCGSECEAKLDGMRLLDAIQRWAIAIRENYYLTRQEEAAREAEEEEDWEVATLIRMGR